MSMPSADMIAYCFHTFNRDLAPFSSMLESSWSIAAWNLSFRVAAPSTSASVLGFNTSESAECSSLALMVGQNHPRIDHWPDDLQKKS